MIFRKLNANEIECRIQSITNTQYSRGVSLLLYKDARVDQRILDETVGAMNWQRHHSRDNANCTVSIWDGVKEQWIEKEDTGTESNTEAAKGLASDSFKRACFNWGIGRELYTAPFIWVTDCEIKQGRNGKDVCYDRFEVANIGYDDSGEINMLAIRNSKTRKVVYKMGNAPEASKPSVDKPEADAKRADKLRYIEDLANRIDSVEGLCKLLKIQSLDDLEDSRLPGAIDWCESLLKENRA